MSRDMTKPTKWVCTQRRLGSVWASAQSNQSSLSAWRKLGSLATHWVHREDWSDWADAQADLSLHWAHSHFVGFVMSWLIYCVSEQQYVEPFSYGLAKLCCDSLLWIAKYQVNKRTENCRNMVRSISVFIKWATLWENLSLGVCDQVRQSGLFSYRD